MKTWGYVIALFVGLSIGWLGQQFWAVDSQSEGISEAELTRSTERLKRLRDESPILGLKPAVIAEQPATGRNFKDRLFNDGPAETYRWLDGQEELLFSDYFGFIKLLVQEMLKQGLDAEVIDILYEQRLGISFEHEDVFQAFVYEIVDQIETSLEDRLAYPELVAMYQKLVNLEPDHMPYSLSLVNWLIQTKSLDRAEEQLVVARNDLEYRSVAEDLARRIEELREIESGDSVSVPLRVKGKHFLATVSLPDGQSAELLLDTGATLTVLKSSVAQNLGLLDYPGEPMTMTTANGTVEGLRLVVPEMGMTGVQMQDVEVGLIPLPGFKFDGLLGMNVLGRFKFFIDQEQQRLLLKK